MTTFQAIVYSIVHSFSIFLPVGHSAHEWFVPYLLDWTPAQGGMAGALMLGSTFSLLIFFRHDWASIISSGLRVLLLWKKPMTLDERLPFFIFISALPVAGIWIYFQETFRAMSIGPVWYAVSLVVFGLPLMLASSMNRKSKNMFNWNWVDALIVGICQVLILVPGAGRQVGALSGALFRNYTRDAAAKFVFFSFLPIFIAQTYYYFQDFSFSMAEPVPGTSWLTFWTAVVVTTLTGLLAIGGFMKNLNEKGFGGYMVYRGVLAAGIISVVLYRSYLGN